MLNQFERWVLYQETVLEPWPDDAPVMPLAEIAGYLKALWEEGGAFYLFDKETASLRIRDLDIDEENKILTLLINLSDQKVSDPVFEHLEQGTLRLEPKLEGEGVALSAHMLISLTSTQAGVSTYRTILEDVPGIGRTKLQPFLRRLLKMCATAEFTDEDGKRKKFRPVTSLVGRMNSQFKDDLSNGWISGIELVRYTNGASEFDEEAYISENSRRLTLDVEKGIDRDTAIELVNRVKTKARNAGYADMFIRYKPSKKRQKSIMVGTAREDAADALVMRSDNFLVEEPLSQCEANLREDVVQKMKNFLIEDRERGN